MIIRYGMPSSLAVLLLLGLSITGCATKTTNLQLDPNLIQFDDSIEPPLEHPYVVFYRHPPKALAYIAAYHSYGQSNATFETIEKVIQEFSPQIAIIEGIQSSEGISPSFYVDVAKQCSQNHFRKCAEGEYTAYLMSTRNALFVGGEPSPSEQVKNLRESGLTDEDIFAYYFLRQVNYLSHNPKPWHEKFAGFLSGLLGNQYDQSFTYDQFKSWYLNRFKKNFEAPAKPANIATQHTSLDSPFGDYRRRIISELRERSIFNEINKAFRKYDRVLVVYGSGHHLKHMRALEAAFSIREIKKYK